MSLTRCQRRVLDCISEFIAERRYSPTLAEIADALGLRSTATVDKHVGNLARKGYVRRGPFNSARSIDVLPEPPLFAEPPRYVQLEGESDITEIAWRVGMDWPPRAPEPGITFIAAAAPLPTHDCASECGLPDCGSTFDETWTCSRRAPHDGLPHRACTQEGETFALWTDADADPPEVAAAVRGDHLPAFAETTP
jgi:hypothetical protein